MRRLTVNTKITADVIADALKQSVLIASAYDSRTGKKKELVFIPYELKYRVTYEDKNERTTTSERHPHDALTAYNAVEI
jgi:hypothetical protein